MADHAGVVRSAVGELELPGVHFKVVHGVSVLRLKSWRSGVGKEGVVLAGQELPAQVGAIMGNGGGDRDQGADVRVLCMGPGDWLVVGRGQQASVVYGDVQRELSHQGLVAVDVSDGFTIIEVQGARVRDVLPKGCGLDLHPRSFPEGRCARTRLGQIPVVVVCVESARFELIVARSYLLYLQAWLEDAAAEFGG